MVACEGFGHSMSHSIPLIRAAAISPILRWMVEHGMDAERALSENDLDWYPWHDPVQPIPLRCATRLLANVSRKVGPGAPLAIVGEIGLFELAMLARVALGTHSPQEAMARIATAIPFHCSHEEITHTVVGDEFVIRENLHVDLEAEERHAVHLYLTAMIGVLFGLAGAGGASPISIKMCPHPEHGFDPLDRRLAETDLLDGGDEIEIRYPVETANSAFRKVARDRFGSAQPGRWSPLIGDGTLASSVSQLLPGMLPIGRVGIDRFAGYASMSRRTFQRRLDQEGAAFSDILEKTRRERAMTLLNDPSLSIGDLSSQIGFAHQATATRAFRRWSGRGPKALQKQ